MELLRFVRRESPQALWVIVGLSCVAGIANAGLVALINVGAAAATNEETSTRFFLLFLVGLVLMGYTSVNAALRGRMLMESAVSKLRVRIYDKLARADLPLMESMRLNEVIAKMSKNVGQVLNSTDILVASSQSALMMIVCSLYLAIMSQVTFIVVMIGVGVLGYVRFLRDKTQKSRFEGLINQEGRQAAFIAHLIEGFKETKINHAKSRELSEAYARVVAETRELGVQTGKRNIMSGFQLQIGVYVILMATVFILPRYMPSVGEQIMAVTAVVLFLVGTFLAMVQTLPVFNQTNAALRDLERLEKQLSEAIDEPPPVDPVVRDAFRAFKQIELRDVMFSYKTNGGDAGFTVGPLELTIPRGELLFIVGGNGTGKSTFLKLLTALYHPDAGSLHLDGHTIKDEKVFYYRDLFAVIFGDFYLFDRLYGCEGVSEEKVRTLIQHMKLEDKVDFKDGRFTTLNLSTGQRKRLALIASLVEDKEIYVFDEWAAEQDQHFREYFYHTILPELKAAGKTVIAVTHDDRYWDRADRVIKFEYGKLVDFAPAAATGSVGSSRGRKRGSGTK